jgi:chromosome segregation protein
MRLRSLQIKGFKSFANETILNFDEDVIGVVGPNGSGKSNIVDAIRWVLGEQKGKELRLDAMSDVIFNGTKTRKEAGVAQVSLTFDNTKNIIPTEYQSVTISRLLYRSGESEYRLNNVTCRLKDIRSLFIDTGIGSNSYAIIALGMVDDILADKDHARRKMFEQASGISKYKTRKKETLNKLKSTTADLDRIEDLLFEIENNLKTLEKQARRTKRYFELKEKYRELSIQYALRSITTLKEEYKNVQSRLKKEEDNYRELDVSFKKQEAELESIKGSNLSQEEQLSQKQKALNDLVNTIRSEENRKNLANQKLGFKNEEIAKIKANLVKASTQGEEVENQIQLYTEKLSAEEERLTNLTQKTEVAQKSYEVKKAEYTKVRSELDAYAKRKESLSQQIFASEKNLAIGLNNKDNINRELAEIQTIVLEIDERLKVNKSEYDIISAEVTGLKKEVENQESFIARKKQELNELEDTHQVINKEISDLFRRKDALNNEYDLLKSMVDSFEGFPESIKFLSTKWKKNVPILSDLLDVDEEFKAIIEQYLDPYLNYYVVENAQEANEAIKLLKDAQKGKASFFLLNKIKPLSDSLPTPSNSIPAASVVNIDKKYEVLLNRLLEGVFIVDVNPEQLENIPEDNDYVFLSASGNFIQKAIELSGGSVGLFEGKRIGRKKNLEKLEKKLDKLEKDLEKQQLKKEKILNHIALAKKSSEEIDIRSFQQKLKLAEEELYKAKYRLEADEAAIKNHQARIENMNLQLAKVLEDINKHEAIIKLSKTEMDNLSNGKLFSDEEIDQLNHLLNIARDEFNALNIEKIRQQNLVDNVRKDLQFRIQRKTDIIEEERHNNQTLLRDQSEVEKLATEINQLEAKLSERYGIRDDQRSKLNEAERNYYAARNIIHEKEDELKKLNRTLNQAQVLINQLKDDFNEIKFKISGVGERLKIEFDIMLNDIINDPVDETLPYDELEAKVIKIKGRLSNFGEINPMAVTAYDEMKERYDTIQTQRADILEAKESLLQTIQEIETTATEQFMESFTQVRKNFIVVFRSLFTEDDTCDLILLDESNPLDSDIEIIAKPKGKKPKSLNQLSGGEKTLTATALLFALYLLKPAPFCIFDEVDAPLDDANIQKFNRIVSNFSNDSQFIIVTHNKSTMAAVDVLYGVYMQEQGVSAVTPVDFRNYEHTPIIEAINN